MLGEDAQALSLDALRDAEPGSDEHRSALLLVDWQADAQSSRQLAALDEREIAWEGSAIVDVDGRRRLQYETAAIEIGNTTDRTERHAIDAARAKLVDAELAPIRRERFQLEREITEQLGLAADYNATFELLSGVSLAALRDRVRGLSSRHAVDVGRHAPGVRQTRARHGHRVAAPCRCVGAVPRARVR